MLCVEASSIQLGVRMRYVALVPAKSTRDRRIIGIVIKHCILMGRSYRNQPFLQRIASIEAKMTEKDGENLTLEPLNSFFTKNLSNFACGSLIYPLMKMKT